MAKTKKRPPLSLQSDAATAFLSGAPVPSPSADIAVVPPSAPEPSSAAKVQHVPAPREAVFESGPAVARGCVVQASGKVKRRLVVHVPVEIGVELERRSEATGASLSRITSDLLRGVLGL